MSGTLKFFIPLPPMLSYRVFSLHLAVFLRHLRSYQVILSLLLAFVGSLVWSGLAFGQPAQLTLGGTELGARQSSGVEATTPRIAGDTTVVDGGVQSRSGSVAVPSLKSNRPLTKLYGNDGVNIPSPTVSGVKLAPVDVSTQVPAPEPTTEFQRFVEQSMGRTLPIYGSKLFMNNPFEPVQASQVPDGYVVGPGDELEIQIYGAVDFADNLTVDRDGRITLPKLGPVKVAGLRYGQLEAALSRMVAQVYRNFKLSVTMGRLRSVEIYLLGQARSPGRKVVGSLSTVINALFETGGPSTQGSLRAIELRRAGKIVTRIDLYDFIARGDNQADRSLEPGDIIYIPPVGPQVAISGSVNEAAIFELSTAGGDLKSILALTGGLSPLAAPQAALLERIDGKRQPARAVQTIALDERGLATALQAGDVITVSQLSPQFSNAVTLQGSVAMPMRYPHHDGMTVRDLVRGDNLLVPVSYWLRINAGTNIGGLDQPEVNLEYATVQRLDTVRLRTETIPFHLTKALLGDPTENLVLKPGDIVRVYGATENTQDAIDSVALHAGFLDGSGVRRSVWRDGARITDLIPDLRWLQDQVTRKARRTGVAVTANDLLSPAAALINAGDKNLLQEQKIDHGADAPLTTNPIGFSLSSLQEVNLEYADVRRLDPLTLEVKLITFHLGKALAGDAVHNVLLQRGDRVNLYSKREVPVPVERTTRLVKVLGEVGVPGTYQVKQGETLPDLILRVGGFTKQADVFGSHFSRESTRVEQQKNLALFIRNWEADVANQSNTQLQNGNQVDLQRQQALLGFQRQSIERLRTTKVSGRIALDLDEDTDHPALPALALEDGDVIVVPKRSDFVSVFGAVDISSAMMYRPGQRVRDYLDRAGLRSFADIDNVFVLKADGTVKTRRTVSSQTGFLGWTSSDGLLDLPLRPGDSILVPEKADRQSGYTVFMNFAKDWTQLIYQMGLGAAAFKALNP